MTATNSGPAQLKSAAVSHGQKAGAKNRMVMITTHTTATQPISALHRPRFQEPAVKVLPARSRRKTGIT
jgi:hypothetical protein